MRGTRSLSSRKVDRVANKIPSKPEEFGQRELDLEVIARAVVEHTARALDKASESTKDESEASPEQLGPREPDVTSIDASTDRETAAFRTLSSTRTSSSTGPREVSRVQQNGPRTESGGQARALTTLSCLCIHLNTHARATMLCGASLA